MEIENEIFHRKEESWYLEGCERRTVFPTYQVNGDVVDKPKKDWSKEDKENVNRDLKAKNIITVTFDLDEFLRVYHYKTSKELWKILSITHEGTNEVKRERLGIVTHEYELFRLKPEENLNEMQKQFTHIVSHMKTPGKTFSNEVLVINILRCLNYSLQPKVIAIFESKDLETVVTHTLFRKLKEHEMKLKIFSINEEGEKKSKIVALKDQESDSDGETTLIVNNCKRFMKNEKNQAE